MRVLYGREDPLRSLIDPANSMVLITGDGGVGKSTLLTACRDTVQSSHLTTVDITRLPHRTGGLQWSILNQLVSITTQLINEQGAGTRVAQKITERARTALGPRRREFTMAVAKELLSIVKERVGSDAGQALGEFFASTSTDNSASTLEVLHTQADADALQAVVDIADEVASLNSDDRSTIFLFFENAQNLSEEDLRQLADLPSMLSERVVLRLEHRDSSDEHRRRIELLRSAGVVEVALSGLTEEVVNFWCRTSGVPESLHKRIYQSTNGYPLFVDDAINQAVANRRVSNISPAENFRISTINNLNDLDAESASAARQLSAFIDPPGQEEIVEILGPEMNAVRWEGVQSRLERARIFTRSTDGTPWFHEVRRQCIWESLSPLLRREVADHAVSFILSSFRDSRDPELLVNLAFVAPDSREVQNDPRAKYLSTACLDDIALISALLEIAEPKEETPSPDIPTSFGDPVFDYCRLVFKADVDALAALERLTASQIIYVAENDHASVLIPRLSELALLVALGRAGAELARFPMPGIASVVFRTRIAPRLREFVTCSYGIGYPKLLEQLSKSNKTYRAARPDHPYGRSVHSVFLRAEIEQQSFYAHATFPDVDTATLSAQDLLEAGGRQWGLQVDVNWVLQLPAGRVRSRRFLTALERVQFAPRANLPFTSEVARKADLLRHMRASCNRLERAVFDLEEATSYVILERERDVMVVEVAGAGDGIKHWGTPIPDDYMFSGPYKWTTLKTMLKLQSGERIRNVTFSTTTGISYEPKRVIETLSNRARDYNRSQPRIAISSSAEALQSALSSAQREAYYDAQALGAVLSQYGSASLIPQKTLLLIYTHGEEGRYFDPQHSEAVYLKVPTPGLSHDAVVVKVAECSDLNFNTEIFGTAFAQELAEIPAVADGSRDWRMFLSVADPVYLLCRELGYEDGAITFHP